MEKTEIDDEVIDVWVTKRNGMNEKVKTSKFNWCAFWFGGYYFLYRKMYLIGILDLIISIVVSFFSIIYSFMYSHIYLQFLVSWVIPIVNGFIFYPLYRMHIKNTLNKNVNQNFSPIQVAQKKGGVNSGAVGIAIGVMFFIYIMLFIFLVSMALVIYNIFEGGRYIYNNFDKDEIYQYFDSYIDRQKPKGLEDYDFDI